MGKNITYILGAGASANALPLAQNIPTQMRELAKEITNVVVKGESEGTSNEKLKIKFIEELNFFANKAEEHSTIDNYAISLSKNDNVPSLITLKSVLSLFFIIKQLQTKIDKRYIPFLTSIFQKGYILSENINILSWNYDIQFELAFLSALNQKLEVADIIKKIPVYPSNKKLAEQPKLVHLNGIAGLYNIGNNNDNINDIFDRTQSKKVEDILEHNLFFLQSIYRGQISNNNFFNFAWENNLISEQSIEYAKQIVAVSDYLVIIGYSFPFFNKEIDKQLFSNFKNLKKIYYQDPNKDGSFLSKRFNLSIEIESRKDIDQFCLPYEL